MDSDPSLFPHRRFNPLLEEYVVVSPHRTKRPWLGQIEPSSSGVSERYDSKCYLCPGNARSEGQMNPVYQRPFTFVNDFSAILPGPAPDLPPPPHPMLIAQPIHGACDVIVYHPHHDLTLARMTPEDIKEIINEWIRIYLERGRQDGIRYVQIFENKGSMMGCSNSHPHGQVWSLSEVPTIPERELTSLKRHATTRSMTDSTVPRTGKGEPCLLCDYANMEVSLGSEGRSRLVLNNEYWAAIVPWWAVWPFEILLLPYKRHITSIDCLQDDEKVSLAKILSQITIRYDNLFQCSFPYSMGIHQRPVPRSGKDARTDDGEFAHLHIHFDPALLRSATVRKFLVGFELMAEPQRDLTPEQAAERLRACSDVHYLENKSG